MKASQEDLAIAMHDKKQNSTSAKTIQQLLGYDI